MNCQHNNFKTLQNIGFDITEDGEERQSLDICEDCKARRMRVVYISFNAEPEEHLDEWEENSPDSFWNHPLNFGLFS